ncbi:MAG TPA: carboxypeptidase regulatory-like domain-containing protein [Blastocatellia bacterium]|nr:carboxypeptidase regulatory-like domain-containing protein [Blastocatellia bacterium]
MKSQIRRFNAPLAQFVPILTLLVLLTGSTATAMGQQVTAAILGNVSDPNGAPVTKAKVTAKDEARGTIWTTETNTEGVFNLPRVPVGSYELRVEAQGFRAAVRPHVQLELNQTARLDFNLVIGEITQVAEIAGALPPLLQTDTTQLGTVIDSRTNEALPLASRNYIQLTLLAPGSLNPNPQTLTGAGTTANSGRPYINGNREQANNFLLDGLDNNQVSDNLVGYTPSPDAIQEFNLITNNAAAEFGNFQGGIISVTIKSGTNEFHGSAFEFFRNDVLNANSWSNNFSGVEKPKLRWNQFGGSLGGPVIKDKLFFFADYQGLRYNVPAAIGALTVFTAAERQGDFSVICSEYDASGVCKAGKGTQLYNPFQRDAAGNRIPFANNRIPTNLIDPVAKALFSSKLYPAPVNGQLENNQFNTSRNFTHGDQGDVKIDYNRSQKDHIFGRYSQSRQDNGGTNSFPLFFDDFFRAPAYTGVANWTRTFSPRLVNEARLGINYTLVNNGGVDNGLGNVAQDLGIQNGNDRGPGLFAINFGAAKVSGFGNANIGDQQRFANTVIQLEDSLIITSGQHIFRTGLQYKRNRLNIFYAGNNGRTGFMTFSGRFTAGPGADAVASGDTGRGEADFLLGLPESLGRGVNTGSWGHRSHVFAGYFQDDWRATKSLTLNLGLRYEAQTPWVEVKDRQVNFDPISGKLQCAGKGRPDLGCGSPATIYDNNRALYNATYTAIGNFQPRIGFAWTPEALGRNTVIRGAYTISSYLEGTGTNLRLPLNPPFTTEFNTTYTAPGTRAGQGLVLNSPSDPFAGAVIRLWNPNVRPAVVQQWNLSVQHQLTADTTLQAGYVGQHGTHLMVPMPYFQRQLLGRAADGSPVTAPSPYLSGNPALKNIGQISGTESNGNQRYDALQTTLQKRFGSGLQAQVAYTFSKAMSNSSGYYGSWGGQTTPSSPYWQNLYDGKAEWGPTFYDSKHVLSVYAVYELPVGRGKKLGGNLRPAANAVVGNWQVSGIYQVRGGFPLTIFGGDTTKTNSRGSRANCIGPANVLGKNVVSGVLGYQWFDPSAYGPAAPASFGTCGVGTVRGPGLNTLDMSFQKYFPFLENKRIEFRSEFINFTNTPILNSPDINLGPNLGRITSSQGSRTIQFALKFLF